MDKEPYTMTPFLQELRYALHQLRHTPGFAQRGDILTLALRGASILLLAGIAIGVGVGLFTAHLVDNFLYDAATSSQHRCSYSLSEHSQNGRLHTTPPLNTRKNFASNSGETE
jgi:hypothetical protein